MKPLSFSCIDRLQNPRGDTRRSDHASRGTCCSNASYRLAASVRMQQAVDVGRDRARSIKFRSRNSTRVEARVTDAGGPAFANTVGNRHREITAQLDRRRNLALNLNSNVLRSSQAFLRNRSRRQEARRVQFHRVRIQQYPLCCGA
jgi:hypothetical protein